MLVLSKGGLSATQAEQYYREKYGRDDYYSEAHTIPGQWYGQGAERLGLQGEVGDEAFRAVLHGRDPRNDALLVEVGPGGERRAGWDATFNAPKSLSLQALVGGDTRLVAAHRVATDRALEELERFVQTRQHRGQEWVTTGNMVAARFEHVAARPSRTGAKQGHGPDPHLHTHVVIANMTHRHDGVWRALDPLELYRSQEHATAVYRATLAQEVQRLGYEITLTGQRGEWELAGYSREQILAFSQRRQDIEKHLADKGLTGAASAQIAAHQTRLAKDFRDERTLRAEWQKRAQGLGVELEQATKVARERGPIPHTQAVHHETAASAVEYARQHHTERQAVVDVRAVEATALQRGMGIIAVEEIREAIAGEQARGELIGVTIARFPQGGFTTREMVGLEKENLAFMEAGQGQAQPLVAGAEVQAWVKARGFYADQIRVVEQTLTARDWVTAIEGKAGATKTTTVGAMRELIESHGYTVQGFGPTTGSVRALAEAGLVANTVASLTARTIEPGEGRKAVWIIDESSLLSTKHANLVLRQAHTAQVERVIFVGDQRQHGAVEAGRPLAQLQAGGMLTARLDTIRRQRDPALRQVVELAANGQLAAAVHQLAQQGRVSVIADHEQRYATMAREYARSVEAGQRVLAVAPANEERVALNGVIRAELQERGMVEREGRAQTILVNRNLTSAERGVAGSYEVGDVVRYLRGNSKVGLRAGDYATVTTVDRERNLVTVRTRHGEEQTYSPRRSKGVEVYREEQRTFAVGERIQFRAPIREQRIANGALGQVSELDGGSGRVTITLDTGRRFSTNLAALRHIEYGYATTSHSSQGATVDRVLVHVDTERSRELVNRQQFYVSISRARNDAQVFTNDREGLALAVQRDLQKATALEAVRESQRNLAQLRVREKEQDRAQQSFTTREIPLVPAQEWRHERVVGKEHPVIVRTPVEWRHDQVLQREREVAQMKEQRQEPDRQPEVQQKREEQRIERGYSRGLGRGR